MHMQVSHLSEKDLQMVLGSTVYMVLMLILVYGMTMAYIGIANAKSVQAATASAIEEIQAAIPCDATGPQGTQMQNIVPTVQ